MLAKQAMEDALGVTALPRTKKHIGDILMAHFGLSPVSAVVHQARLLQNLRSHAITLRRQSPSL